MNQAIAFKFIFKLHYEKTSINIEKILKAHLNTRTKQWEKQRTKIHISHTRADNTNAKNNQTGNGKIKHKFKERINNEEMNEIMKEPRRITLFG